MSGGSQRRLLATGTVAAVVAVNVVAGLLAPSRMAVVMAPAGCIALIFAVRAVVVDSHQIVGALVPSLLPVVTLIVLDSYLWLVAPLATLLLVAAELCAWSWDCRGVEPGPELTRHRLGQVVRLMGYGFATAVVAGLLSLMSISGGTVVVLAAGFAVAGFGYLVFARTTGRAG